jgi:hypothetical protein
MPNNSNPSGPPLIRKKYTPAFKAECVHQVAAGTRQTDVTRAQGGLRALSTRPQSPRTTVAAPTTVVAENMLLGQPVPTAPNQVWVISPTCPWSAGVGVIWPPGVIPVRGAWWAGTSPADAHRTGAHCPRVGSDATSASIRADYPR